MSATLTATGLEIESFDESLEGYADSLGIRLGLTDYAVGRIKTDLKSLFGNLCRILAEGDTLMQEALLSVYGSFGLEAEGAPLDRAVRLLGMNRIPELASRVTGTVTGTVAYAVQNGTRFEFDDEDGDLDDGTIWTVVDGPYTVGGGGTVTVTLEADDDGALEPGASEDWTLLDAIPQITAFESTAQPVVGNDVETDAELRTRAETEAYRRGQGPLAAIEAAVIEVTGVTYVRAWDNPTDATDADGIPARAINVVVEGGDDDAIIEAILSARPAGARLYGTDVSESYSLGGGRSVVVAFDRIDAVPIHIRVTLTTSTAEELAPAGITTTVETLVLEQAEALFGIGDDILPWKLEGAIYAEGYPGIERAVVETSLDGSSWSTNKRVITIRQKGTFSAANTTVTET